VPLCNGEKTVVQSDESGQRGRDVDSQTEPSNDAELSSAASVNERLCTSSVNDNLPLTETSRSSLNDSSLLTGDATSLSQLASQDVSQSVVAHP